MQEDPAIREALKKEVSNRRSKKAKIEGRLGRHAGDTLTDEALRRRIRRRKAKEQA